MNLNSGPLFPHSLSTCTQMASLACDLLLAIYQGVASRDPGGESSYYSLRKSAINLGRMSSPGIG